LKIDEEAGTVTTTTVPNVHTTPVTTVVPITTTSEVVTTTTEVPTTTTEVPTTTTEVPITTTEVTTTEGYYGSDSYGTDDGGYGDNEVSDEVLAMRAAVEAKLSAWQNRSKLPCKVFKEKLDGVTTRWNVCPFGDVETATSTDGLVYNENAYWKEEIYCITAEGVHDECAEGKKLEISFLCITGTRDAVRTVVRSEDECTLNMEIATNSACVV